jgi:PAS domain S-box-containing protein
MRPLNFSNLYSADGNKKLHVLWEDGERIFCGGECHPNSEHRSVLVVLPAAENPAPATIERLSHEFGLKEELDPAWAARPLRLVLDSERAMLVLEDPGGRPLDRHLGRPMEVTQFLRLAINISAALRGLHERGMIHKDVKPANILVDSAIEKVWLTGFGIASRLPRERQAPPEPPETIAGTLAYMAPEQTGRMNRSIDSRSDLYAVGVSFYELLTGRLPFTAADSIELIHCHIAREPAPPGELASEVPAPLSMIVMKLLAKTAEERYQTAAGVEADLRKCLVAWESFGRIDPFPLGLQDASERLIIPEKLYGRDGEIATLLATFRGFEKLADFFLGEARDCYARWRALAKVAQLDQSRHVGQQPPLSPKPTIEAAVEQFDLATVIKMSEAVAGEIVLEKLIERLMVIAIEHAGADRGLLLLPHGAQYRIEAEARSGRDGVRVRLLETPVAPLELPVRILERVIRTRSQVILDDARGLNAFVGDDYIGRKPARSLLCLPLLKQAELTGILYLENSLATHVFTPARIAVLKLLASQAAIALENARLYRDVAEREAKIRRLVDANIIGIFISNGKEKIIEANDAFLRMLGYDRKDLALGRIRWTDLTAPEWRDRNSQMVEEVKATGIARPRENEYLRKDGNRVPVLVGAASFEKTENQRVAFVVDLTERRRAEEALRELESDFVHMNRVSMLGELAASLSHEIAQPISSARNNARAAQNFLVTEPSDLGEVREALASVVADTDRVGEIIDRIREQIKKAPPRKERFDLNSAINEVVTLARSVTNRNSVLIETRHANRFSVVHGDRVQLQQVLLNLILNAVEAMGAVDTGARELLISTEREQTGVLVAVRDSGPGIDPTHLERMFEAFYTTKSGGTGMGLSICRSIIDAHGGRLWAGANQPHGAVFWFTLPDANESSEVVSSNRRTREPRQDTLLDPVHPLVY